MRKVRVYLYCQNWESETCLVLGTTHITSSRKTVQNACTQGGTRGPSERREPRVRTAEGVRVAGPGQTAHAVGDGVHEGELVAEARAEDRLLAVRRQ
eukprot:504053-Prymnesium_polylepis.1